MYLSGYYNIKQEYWINATQDLQHKMNENWSSKPNKALKIYIYRPATRAEGTIHAESYVASWGPLRPYMYDTKQWKKLYFYSFHWC